MGIFAFIMSFTPFVGGVFMAFEALLGTMATGEKMTPVVRGRYIWYAVGSIVSDITLVGIPLSSVGKIWFRALTMKQLRTGSGLIATALNSTPIKAALNTTPIGRGVNMAMKAKNIVSNIKNRGNSNSQAQPTQPQEQKRQPIPSRNQEQKGSAPMQNIPEKNKTIPKTIKSTVGQPPEPTQEKTEERIEEKTLQKTIPQKMPVNLTRKTALIQGALQQGKKAEKEIIEKLKEHAPEIHKELLKKLQINDLAESQKIAEKLYQPKISEKQKQELPKLVMQNIKKYGESTQQ